MFEIDITNDQQALVINEPALRRVLLVTLELEQVTAATLSIAIVDNAEIHRLNRQFLEHDFPTDVISFLLEESLPNSPTPHAPRGAGKKLDGELIISAEMAVERAPEFGWSPEEEFQLYAIHGLLHLCGYDDLTDEEEPLMRAREREVLARLGVDQR